MKMTPVKGTADYLPRQTLLRDYLQQVILETYRSAGFERILTPAIEDLENLEKSDGGDNLNLMFKIMKRGDKLSAALESGEPLVGRAALMDTMKDLIVDTIGALVMAVIGYISIRYQKGWVEKFQLRREKKRTKNIPN